MKVQTGLQKKLTEHFKPRHLEIINESDQHNVPPGSESHFKLVLVSDDFAGKTLVARHQSVYKILNQDMQDGIHALALHTYTPQEWEARQNPVPASPLCHGGGK